MKNTDKDFNSIKCKKIKIFFIIKDDLLLNNSLDGSGILFLLFFIFNCRICLKAKKDIANSEWNLDRITLSVLLKIKKHAFYDVFLILIIFRFLEFQISIYFSYCICSGGKFFFFCFS